MKNATRRERPDAGNPYVRLDEGKGARHAEASRQDFIKGALAVPTLVAASAPGADAPSKKITMAIIGCGTRGGGGMEVHFLQRA